MKWFIFILFIVLVWEIINYLIERVYIAVASEETLSASFDLELRDLADKYGFEVTDVDDEDDE